MHEKDYDAVVVYAASGSGDLLKACFAPKKDRDTIIFVRHRSGTTYYWYEALSTKYLQTGRPGRPQSCLDHGGVHVDDVVVDDYDELLWRLRALYAPQELPRHPHRGAWAGPGANTRPRPRKSPATNTGSRSSTFRTRRSPRASRRPGRTATLAAAPSAVGRSVSGPAAHDADDRQEFVTNAFVLYSVCSRT